MENLKNNIWDQVWIILIVLTQMATFGLLQSPMGTCSNTPLHVVKAKNAMCLRFTLR